MWKQIDANEYFTIAEQKLIQHDKTKWCDFIELEWRTEENQPVLRKTEQENYDEFESYPSTVSYYKWV